MCVIPHILDCIRGGYDRVRIKSSNQEICTASHEIGGGNCLKQPSVEPSAASLFEVVHLLEPIIDLLVGPSLRQSFKSKLGIVL